MLGFFPTPHEDECFYSLCARYIEIVKYPCREKSITDLFNKRGLSVAIDLPSSLNIFSENLGIQNIFSAERVINNHSLFPYYAPFLPRNRVETLIDAMKSNTGEAVHKISGITAASITKPNNLRYCPSCAIEEINQSGILYWHRLHQLPGVFVCPKHYCFLEDSSANLAKNTYKANLFSPQEYILSGTTRKLNFSNENHQILLSIAQDSEWLLKTNIKCPGYENLEKVYMSILRDQDLVFPSGSINLKVLRKKIRFYYGADLLDLLQCNFDDNKGYQWVSSIIPHLRMKKVNHPLRHLLLIRILGFRAETFFSYKIKEHKNLHLEDQNYFIRGPYPCLNPVCEDFKKLTIKSCKIMQSKVKRKLKTLFVTCHCGFSYYRHGPDLKKEDVFRKDVVTGFGDLWEERLTQLWNEEIISVQQMYKILGVSAERIKSHALALGLKFPRSVAGTKVMMTADPITQEQIQRRYSEKQNKIKENRQNWLSILAKYPRAKRSEMFHKIAPSIARFLYTNDREWFSLNQPKVWKRTESARQINWEQRDKECADKIRKIVSAIKERDGKPVWIRSNSIAREFNKRDWITHGKYKKKMPLTQKAIQDVTETRIDYNLRRIYWAIDCIKQDGSSYAFSSIGMRALVNWDLWKIPDIKQAIETGIEEIKKHRGLL